MTEVPAGWRIAQLGEVADTTLGKMLDRGHARGLATVPYLRNVNVQWGRIDTHDLLNMELADGDRERFAVQPGDLLVCEGGEIGRAAIWHGRTEYLAFQKALHRIRGRGKLNLSYLRYLLELYRDDGTLERFATGSTIAHLPQQKLRALPVPMPPMEEQRRIVDILEDHLSRLDAAESGIAASTARLVSLKERVLSAGLLGETMPGPRQPVELTDCGTDDGPLPELPMGWSWRRLGEITSVAGGVTKDSKRQADPAFVEVPYLRVANVQRGRLDLGLVTTIRVPASKAHALRLLPGDVLMNEGGDRDKLARGWVWEGQVTDCIHQNHVFRARVVDEAIEPKLLSWAANTIGGRWAERNGKQSVNLASISLTKIRQMPVPVSPKEIQPELVKQLDDQLQACNRLAVALDEARARAATLRRSLLAAAFSGRLTGRSSDLELAEELSVTAI